MLMSRPVFHGSAQRLAVKPIAHICGCRGGCPCLLQYPSVCLHLICAKHTLCAPSHTHTHTPSRTPSHAHLRTRTFTPIRTHVRTHNRTPSCRESHGDLDVEEGVDAPDLILKIHGKKKVKKMRIDSEGEEETDSEQDDDDDDDEEEEVWARARVFPPRTASVVELVG
jgi:hypothetical protein